MELPSRKRYLLQVNGEELADADFVGMFVSLASLRAGAGLPTGDPYEVPGLEEHRDAAKLGLLSLLSRSSDMQRLSPELKAALPEGWTAKRLADAMAARHPRIAHLFGTDIGIDLMFAESQILVALLLRLGEQGVPGLGMHDGLLVPTSGQDIALDAMQAVSREITGTALPVKAKPIWRPPDRAAA